MHAQRGEWEAGIEHFRITLELNPGDAKSHTNLGAVLTRQGRWQAAIEHFRQAVRINPSDAKAHHNWALALAQQGKWNEAIEQLRHHDLGAALRYRGR